MRLIHKFVQDESFSGWLLMLAACLALFLDNSSLYQPYHVLLDKTQFFNWDTGHSLSAWINHGLMSLFFLTVGLEIKREIREGELSSRQRALLPGLGALGGMLVPSLLFVAANWHYPEHWPAWSVPVATDIAFSLGVLSLLGKRVPFALKLFLMALAIFDDLGAIAIIAIFYTQTILWGNIFISLAIWLLLWMCNYFSVRSLSVYLCLGALLWWFLSKSGIDATIAGVLLAVTIPLNASGNLLATQLEKVLHPWVTYLILPIFALTNAGVHLANVGLEQLINPLTLGIILGLLVGKPLGVMVACYLAVKFNFAKLPSKVTWSRLVGVAILCGIGFTMSLLLAELAFGASALQITETRMGILIGSLLAGIVGYTWLSLSAKINE